MFLLPCFDIHACIDVSVEFDNPNVTVQQDLQYLLFKIFLWASVVVLSGGDKYAEYVRGVVVASAVAAALCCHRLDTCCSMMCMNYEPGRCMQRQHDAACAI